MRVKDAVCDRQRAHANGKRSSVKRVDPDIEIVVFAGPKEVEISLNTSGPPFMSVGIAVKRVRRRYERTWRGISLWRPTLSARW